MRQVVLPSVPFVLALMFLVGAGDAVGQEDAYRRAASEQQEILETLERLEHQLENVAGRLDATRSEVCRIPLRQCQGGTGSVQKMINSKTHKAASR